MARMKVVAIYGIVLSVMALAMAGATAAQEVVIAGSVEATAHEKLAAQAPIRVRRPDGSALSADIANVFSVELQARGHATDGGDAYVLTFRLSDDPKAIVSRPPNIELRGELGPSGQQDAEVLLRMQLLKKDLPEQRTRIRHMVVSVTDRTNRLIWEARADVSGAGDDDFKIAAALVPYVLDRLGQTVFRQRIP